MRLIITFIRKSYQKKKVNKYSNIYTNGKVASIIWLITPSYTVSSTYKPIIIYEVYFNI